MSCGLYLFTPSQTCSGLASPVGFGTRPAEGACIKIDNTKYSSILIPAKQQCRCTESTKSSYIVFYSDELCQDDLNRAVTPSGTEQCVDVQTPSNVAKGMRYECVFGAGNSSSSSSAISSSAPSPTTINSTPPSTTPLPSSTSSTSSGLSGTDKIAIGVGLGMGLPPIIISVILLILRIRKDRGKKGAARAEMDRIRT